MFERFYRVEGQKSRSFEGSGIGLALSNELVRLHGGTMEVRSLPGQGSTFTVALPLGHRHLPADRIVETCERIRASSYSEAFVKQALRWLPDVIDSRSDIPAMAQGHDAGPGAKATISARAMMKRFWWSMTSRPFACWLWRFWPISLQRARG